MTRPAKRFAVGAVVVLALSVVAIIPFRLVVHSVKVAGAPGRTIEFFTYRSALDSALGRNGGYFVRVLNGPETKTPLVPGDVPFDELRRDSSAQDDGTGLVVRGPRGRWMALPGYHP